MRFPFNKGFANCLLTELSRETPAPLPGGFREGQHLYFTSASQSLGGRGWLLRGARGEAQPLSHPRQFKTLSPCVTL